MWDKILRRIWGVQQNDTEEAIPGPKKNGKSDAPNIFLNLRPPKSHKEKVELQFWAAFAVILQAGVLVFSGCATYHPRMAYEKEGNPVERYAYPLTAGGTLLVALGILICCLVVEGSTAEKVWTFGKPARILWLQKGGNFNDQYFDSYAVFAHGLRPSILTSQLSMSVQAAPVQNQTTTTFQTSHSRAKHEQTDDNARTLLRETVVVLATTTSIGGFIIQFTGLRGMHWSATIAQLIATVVMVAVRAWIRRDLASTRLAYKVPEGFEMEWLATRLSRKSDADTLWGVQHPSMRSVGRPLSVQMRGSKKTPLIDRARSTVQKLATQFHRRKVNRSGPSDTWEGLLEERCWYWNVASGYGVDDFIFRSVPMDGSTGHRVMKMRKRIGSLCNWTGSASQPAVSLANAIEVVMNTLFPKGDDESIFWIMNSQSHEEPSKIFLSVKRNKKAGFRWKANAAEIESVLSLWMYSMHAGDLKLRHQAGDSRTPVEGDDEDWLRDGNTALRNTTIRLLGRGNELYLRDLQWHLGAGFDAIKEVTRYGESEM